MHCRSQHKFQHQKVKTEIVNFGLKVLVFATILITPTVL